MSAEEIREIIAAARGATGGEWTAEAAMSDFPECVDIESGFGFVTTSVTAADGRHIVATQPQRIIPLLEQLLALRKRAALLDALEELVKHGTERRGQSLCLMFDHEDGYWLSTVDTGCHHHPVKDIDYSKRETLGDAIQAAVEWHNGECTKPNRSYLIPISIEEDGK